MLSILNVGDGDTKLSFDPQKPEELEKAKRAVTDMLKLGYAIMIKVGEAWERVKWFDPAHCDYLIDEAPAEGETKTRKQRKPNVGRRVPAQGTPAVGVARSAGGMSTAANSIEAENEALMDNLRSLDNFADLRHKINTLARVRHQWAGIPMPLDGMPLVVEPKFPNAQALMAFNAPEEEESDGIPRVTRNRFYSVHKRCDVLIWNERGHIEWSVSSAIHSFDAQLQTLGASVAWGIEQEANALQTLAPLIRHHQFKQYLMTGMFIESSQRSHVSYVFRKLRPTVAIVDDHGKLRILAGLCMHPIAYYRGSWAGAMCPTDDVIAHLMLMRGDERLFWRRCNQHPAHRPEAGL